MLARYGKIDPVGKGDYWLVDENLGLWCLQVELRNLNLLNSSVIKELQELLTDYPDWEIAIRVVVVGQEDTVMGLVIANDEIIDELRRECLPPEFRSVTYAASKRLPPRS